MRCLLEASHNYHKETGTPFQSTEKVLFEKYLSDIDSGKLSTDHYQKDIILELQILYNNLILTEPKSTSYFSTLFTWHTNKNTTEVLNKGLYIWGGVGRGKTFLVNYFFKHLPIERKLRLHFHRFMQLVHEELDDLDGISDPLKIVATGIAKKAKLLYLDEIMVNDITDAMLLGKLFEHLLALDVVLITTSNIPPDELYKEGLQRDRFLPAIALLERYTKVVKIGGEVDYRFNILEKNGLYHIADNTFSGNTSSEEYLEHYFHQLAGIELHNDRTDIIINKRQIPVKRWADDVVWFSFKDLCNTPRSAIDYIQIAHFFNTVLISDIPIMDSSMDDAARRFVIMVDEFYDLHVNLVVSAAAAPEQLYTANKLAFEFKRTASRLREMQSTEYIKNQSQATILKAP